MIVYFDTSALVPLLVAEPASAGCRSLWAGADDVVTCRLAFVETAAALAQAQRLGRITALAHREALRGLDRLWAGFSIVEIDEGLMRQAADHAARHELRGYDAVHCAAAALVADQDTVAASGDRALLGAWSALGVSTVDTHGLARR